MAEGAVEGQATTWITAAAAPTCQNHHNNHHQHPHHQHQHQHHHQYHRLAHQPARGYLTCLPYQAIGDWTPSSPANRSRWTPALEITSEHGPGSASAHGGAACPRSVEAATDGRDDAYGEALVEIMTPFCWEPRLSQYNGARFIISPKKSLARNYEHYFAR